MGEHDEFIADFLEECDENLDQLDQELVALEEDPRNEERLRSIFRNVHTIKGSSGFFGFTKLGALAHEGEGLLGKIRDGELAFNQAIASGLLKMSDAVREILASIETTGSEGEKDYSVLTETLRSLLTSPQPDSTQPDSTQPDSPDTASSQSDSPQPDGSRSDATVTGVVLEADVSAAGNDADHETRSAGDVEDSRAVPAKPVVTPADGDAAVADSGPVESNPIASNQSTPAPEVGAGAVATDESDAQSQLVGEVPIAADAPSETAADIGAIKTDSAKSASSSAKSGSSSPLKGSDSGSIRVDIGLLDELMDFAGELVLARNALFQCNEVTENPRLAGVTSRVSQITSEIQDRVTRTRMQPIGAIWGKFRRIVRDLSVACGKEVRLELIGEETELDRSLLEAIRDPLTHIIRNGVDHGIESPDAREAAGKPREGTLRLWARHESGQVVIEASDDGGGIDVEKIRSKAIAQRLMSAEEAAAATPGQVLQCIFEPGFSTAQAVSEISGRGVGMDVVRSHIEKIGGSVRLRSKLGQGTTLTIKIPLTLAIVPALMISSGGQRFVIPQAGLLEVVTVGGSNPIERLHDVPVCRLRDRLLPLLWLDDLLGISEDFGGSDSLNDSNDLAIDQDQDEGDARMSFPVAVVQADQLRYGIVIDEVLNTHEIVVKPVGVSIKSIGAFAAATILGDGSVSLILDIGGIARMGGLIGDDPGQRTGPIEESAIDIEGAAESEIEDAAVSLDSGKMSLLICEIGEGREIGIPLETVERLEELPIDSIEQVESGPVASYRGGVLPLRFLDALSSEKRCDPAGETNTVQVVVHRKGGQLVGASVKRVVDIIDVPRVVHHSAPDDDGLTRASASALESSSTVSLVDGRVLEVVDLGDSP